MFCLVLPLIFSFQMKYRAITKKNSKSQNQIVKPKLHFIRLTWLEASVFLLLLRLCFISSLCAHSSVCDLIILCSYQAVYLNSYFSFPMCSWLTQKSTHMLIGGRPRDSFQPMRSSRSSDRRVFLVSQSLKVSFCIWFFLILSCIFSAVIY